MRLREKCRSEEVALASSKGWGVESFGRTVALVRAFVLTTFFVVTAPALAQEGGSGDYYTAANRPLAMELLRNVEKYHLGLGFEDQRRKAYHYAKQHWEFILHRFPNHPQALKGLTDTCRFWKNRECEDIDDWLDRAIEINPRIADTYTIIGMYRYGMGQTEQAIENYKTAIEVNPGSINAHYNLGLAYHATRQYQAANLQAQYAYALGAPYPGLRDLLKKAGAWKPVPLPELPTSEMPAATTDKPASGIN